MCLESLVILTGNVVMCDSDKHAQFMFELSNVSAISASVKAAANNASPPSLPVTPVKVTAKAWTAFTRVADTVSRCVRNSRHKHSIKHL